MYKIYMIMYLVSIRKLPFPDEYNRKLIRKKRRGGSSYEPPVVLS